MSLLVLFYLFKTNYSVRMLNIISLLVVLADFFTKRRRTTETKSILNPLNTSSSEAALCKTIR